MTWVVGQVVTADQLNNPIFTSVNGIFNIAAAPFNAVAASSSASTTNAAAILAAYNAAAAVGGGMVMVPPGEFFVDMGVIALTSAHNGVTLIGAGVNASRLRFVPTAAGQIALSYDTVVEGGIRDLTIFTADTTLMKTAISLLKTDKFIIRNVTLGYAGNNWTGGAGSQGIVFNGHNFSTCDMVFIYADQPIRFSYNATSVGNDECLFRDMQLAATGSTLPLILVDSDASVGSMTWDGTNDWSGGSDGFKLVGAAATSTAGLLSFNNIRWEDPTGTTGFMFDIEPTAAAQMFTFNNCSHGAAAHAPGGFKFRNVNWATIRDYRATAIEGRSAIDIDATVAYVLLENFIVASATPTYTTAGQTLVYDASTALGDVVALRIYLPTATRLPNVLANAIGLGGAVGSASTLKQYGTTSGSLTQAVAAAVGGNFTITWPGGTTDFTATGGTSQVVKQTTAGGAFTVATVASSDLANLGTGVATWLATPSSANLASAMTDETGTAGSLVFSNGPSFVAPVLGTPASGDLSNCTNFPVSGLSGLGTGVSTALAINVGSSGAFVQNGGVLGTPTSGTLTNCTGLPIGTGVSGLGANVATFLGTPTSANLASAVTNETGSGALVFDTDPTFSNAIGVGAYIQGQEITEPSNPPSNQWRFYAVDSSGKTQLRVIFASGGGIAIATEA